MASLYSREKCILPGILIWKLCDKHKCQINR